MLGLDTKAVAESLYGLVINAADGSPVPLAHVYLAGTTIGDVSDGSGFFRLEAVPPGYYTLVASHIGYQTFQQQVRIAQDLQETLLLYPRVIDLPEIRVEAQRDPEWRRLVKEFETAFLGTAGSEQCRLLNPEVLRLERREKTLFAHCIEPLVIENRALGYQVSVIIKSFELEGDQVKYHVLPFFRHQTTEAEEQKRVWDDNRRRAFFGSYRHFFHALLSGALESAGFVVERVDDRRPFSAPLERFSSTSAKGKLYSDMEYALFKKIHFRDFLRIRWLNNYARTSYLELPTDTLTVDWRGNSMSDPEIIRSGFWGERRFAEELPWDYLP